MIPVHYPPLGGFKALRRELHRLLGRRALGAGRKAGEPAAGPWAPVVDIHEDAEGFLISADIPGVDPDKLELKVGNGILSLRGERHQEKDAKDKNAPRAERGYGMFFRQFALPDYADTEHVVATSRNGVLEIRVPRKTGEPPQRASVES